MRSAAGSRLHFHRHPCPGSTETLRVSWSLSECECDIADFLRGHGSGSISSALPPPRGWAGYRQPWLRGVCRILTDTVCDLQRQAEQMLVMRSPWAPGLRPTFKPDLSLYLLCFYALSHTHTHTHHSRGKSQGIQSHLDENETVEMQEKDKWDATLDRAAYLFSLLRFLFVCWKKFLEIHIEAG